MSDLIFRRESYSSMIDGIKTLLPSHWRELARNRDDIPLDPDYDMYRRADAAGMIMALAARLDGALVGYAIYFVRPHHHYKGATWAVSDIFWLHPDYRNLGNGKALFEAVEQELRNIGCTVCHTTLKADHPAAAYVLEALGHTKIELGYSKRLSVH